MNKEDKNLLSDSEFVAVLVGYIIGVGFLILPSIVAKEAKQSGWISVILGALYPLYLSLLCIYYCNSHPNENILILSRKYLGRFLGNICNLIFITQYVLYIAQIAAGLNNVYAIYATPFLKPLKILLAAVALATYASIKGLKVIGRVNKIVLFLTVTSSLSLITALLRGSYLNLTPLLSVGGNEIFKGTLESIYTYGGIEAVFLLYPFAKNKNKVGALAFKATYICVFLYVWNVVMCFYFLGYRVTAKALWPVLLVTESINLPIINSTRFIFLLLWTTTIFNVLANEYYAVAFSIQEILNMKSSNVVRKKFVFGLPIIIYFALELDGPIIRRSFLGKVIPKITLFNIIFITVIAILIFVNNKQEKKSVGE